MLIKIISGGQTGADIAGLIAGKLLGLQTGGTAPAGYRTENGSNQDLIKYGVIEHKSANYQPRTIENVRNSDGTVWFGNQNSPGGKLTINTCIKLKKPHIINPSKTQLRDWIERKFIRVLNCSGNRESTNIGIQEHVKNFLIEVLKYGSKNESNNNQFDQI